jgi:predicted amidohydrolase YtcJ
LVQAVALEHQVQMAELVELHGYFEIKTAQQEMDGQMVLPGLTRRHLHMEAVAVELVLEM